LSTDDVVRAADPSEPHSGASAGRLNWLRAGVLGANDGIVSVAGIVVGVAGATTSRGPVFTAGLAGLVAGAVSMSLGEYVSVSSQRDSETALLSQERRELAETPDQEFNELTALYQARGLSEQTARQVATELTAHDALAAHLDAELHINPEDLANPLQAAAASAASFTWGLAATDRDPAAADGVAGAGDDRRRADRAGPGRRGQCPDRPEQRPACRDPRGRRRCHRPGLHLRRRPPLRHRDRLGPNIAGQSPLRSHCSSAA
jgi:hypothetical protein